MQVINSLTDLPGMVGTEFPPGDWHEVSQDQINLFADATGDHQWIHVDVERARAGPFGATVAHGYLTLSLVPILVSGIVKVEGVKLGLNYGLNRVRFPAPLRAGSRVRARAVVKEATEIPGGIQAVFEVTVETEGGEKPVCVAETVVRYLG